MTVEAANYISQLDDTLPPGGDPKSEGDNHIRLIKTVLVDQLGSLGTTNLSVTAAQLNDVTNKALRAGDTYSGTHNFTGATTTVATQSQGDNSTKASSTAYVDLAVASASVASYTYTTTATSKTVANLEHCVVTATGQTISAPATPSVGNTFKVTFRNACAGTIGRNGSNLLGLAEDMAQPFLNGPITLTFVYANSTDGWVFE